MIGLVLALIALGLALIPALLFHSNLRLYRTPPLADPKDALARPAVSVLIPARNEGLTIAKAVQAALASEDVELEVIVLDDNSNDSTASIVREIAARDHRVRLEIAPPLPENWCGKQHACHVLSQLASNPLLVFLDADVRLDPKGLARAVTFLNASGADLISGVPYQETKTIAEKLVIPLIHFILLGFLPLARMRRSLSPGYSTGCGQFFMARRTAYQQAGGHAGIRQTLHDGLKLPRAFRQAGLKTDLCDATDLATCRMYRDLGEVWHGFAKNAREGLASRQLILPATLLLFGGQVLPIVLCILGLGGFLTTSAWVVALGGTILTYYTRIAAAVRFRQSWLGVFLHPAGVLLFLAIQWYAFGRFLTGHPVGWKGRIYPR